MGVTPAACFGFFVTFGIMYLFISSILTMFGKKTRKTQTFQRGGLKQVVHPKELMKKRGIEKKAALVGGTAGVVVMLLLFVVPKDTANAIWIVLIISGVLFGLFTFLINTSKPEVQSGVDFTQFESKKEKYDKAILPSSDINYRIIDSPTTRPRKDPVRVRGDYWVNTEEERWEMPEIITSTSDFNVKELIQQLKNIERAEIRCSAANGLEKLGQEATPAIPDLLISSIDSNKDVREASLKALKAIDSNWPNNPDIQQSIPNLVAALENHSSKDVLISAKHLLQLIGISTIPCLSASLIEGEDTVNKIYILQLLSQLKSNDESAIHGVTRALSSQHLHVRIAAANTLAALGPTEDAIPALVSGLSDSFPTGRIAMASCLGQIGAKAEPAIPSLISLLIDRNNDVREAAAETMVQIGTEAVPALIEIVNTQVVDRLKAWFQAKNEILRRIKEPQHDMIITDYYKTFASLTWAALDMLEKRDCRELAQEAALGVLGRIGSGAADSVPVIINALKDANPRIRAAAAQALGQIGPFDKSTLEKSISGLIYTLVDRNKSVREASTKAIKKFKTDQISGELVKKAINSISRHLDNPGEDVIDAFVLIGVPSIPILIDTLESGNRVARQNAAKAMGLIGPEAESALPVLIQALQDNHPWVQEEITNAISKIQGNTA